MGNPVQRGRWIVTVGALITGASVFLQWWRLGGGPHELSATTGIGIEGSGFLLFLAMVATMGLVTLRYASDAPLTIDHPLSYLALLVAGIAAYVWRMVDLYQQGLLLYSGQTPPLQPLRGPGMWIAAVGLVVLARGVFELWEARRQF
jgi:hypothetical protein